MHGLQQGNDVLKEIHKEMNIEAVEKLLEETVEAREYQRVRSRIIRFPTSHWSSVNLQQEVDEMLANNLTAEDEDEVQAELKALQREAVCARIRFEWPELIVPLQSGETKQDIKLPSAPTQEPVTKVPEGVYPYASRQLRLTTGNAEIQQVPTPEERERVPVLA